MTTTDRPAHVGECGITSVEGYRVTCTRTGRLCTLGDPNSSSCTSLGLVTEQVSQCFDPSATVAFNVCLNNGTSESGGPLFDVSVNLGATTSVALDGTCLAPTRGAISVGLSSSTFSTTVGGTTTPLTARGGFATMDYGCDQFEHCHVTTIDQLRLVMNDATINGFAFRNTVIDLLDPVSIDPTGPTLKIRAGTMKLRLTTDAPQRRETLVIRPNADLTVASTPNNTLQFSGTFGAVIPTGGRTGMPVTISASVTANTTSAGAQCSGFSAFQELTGFEALTAWSVSPGSISPNTALHTQGCYGLSVGGSNFRTLISGAFATPLSGGKARLLLDVYVPPNQPNPSWQGAVQVLMSCPAAGVNNVFLGQAELTGKPTAKFSTVSYNVPSSVQAALAGSTSDCRFNIGVNSNATPTPIVLDNLRFSL